MTSLHIEGRGARPGLRASDAGSVTVEAAGALMALTIFFAMLVSGLAAFGGELVLTSLARDAARAAAVQSDAGSAHAAVASVLRKAENVDWQLRSDGTFVEVSLQRPFRVLRLPTPLRLSARATAYEESPW